MHLTDTVRVAVWGQTPARLNQLFRHPGVYEVEFGTSEK